MTSFEARPVTPRESVHPSITAKQISDLVDEFYERVQNDLLLGPIFDLHMNEKWGTHLDKMKGFWRSVLLRTGEYKGKPVPVHLKINNIDEREFSQWLKLFSQTAARVMEPQAAALVDEAARRIATSLWLSRQESPFSSPPQWTEILNNTAPSNS